MKLLGDTVVERRISYYSAFDEAKHYYEEDFLIENKKYQVYEREKYFIDPPEEKKENEGLKRLNLFEDILFNRFKYKPQYFQRKFLKLIVMAMAETIVGKQEWLSVGPTIIKQRGWTSSTD